MFKRAGYAKLFAVCLALLLLPAKEQGQVAGPNNNQDHSAIECTLCHQLNVSQQPAETSSQQTTEKCRICHHNVSTSKRALSDTFHQSNDRNCSSCHRFHQPNLLLLKNDTTLLEVVRTEGGICRDCHRDRKPPEISAGHRIALSLAHSNKDRRFAGAPSQFCLVCHGEHEGQDRLKEAVIAAPRIDPHSSHPFGIPLRPELGAPNSLIQMRREIDARISIVDGRLECQSCHTLLSKSRHLLVVSGNTRELCLGCHKIDNDFTSVTASAITN